jgi:hypothetical protein
MSKIEEISELLIEELSEFDSNIKKLKSISDDITQKELKLNTDEFDSKMNELLIKQKNLFDSHNNKIVSFSIKIENSKTYPNWMLGLLLTFLILIFSFIGYSFYRINKIPDLETTAYNDGIARGRKEAMNHFGDFFEKHKQSKRSYNKWMKSETKDK